MSIDQWVKIAEIATPTVAVIALLITIWQIKSTQKTQWEAIKLQGEAIYLEQQSQREATAKGLYNEYLKLSLEYPEYSSPNWFSLSVNLGGTEFKRYAWFVSYMLHACEEILKVFSGSREWINTIERHLRYHRNFLIHLDEASIERYNDTLQQLIKEVIKK